VSLYKVAMTMAKIGRDNDGFRAREIVQEALNLTDKDPGNDRQRLIDALSQALQQLGSLNGHAKSIPESRQKIGVALRITRHNPHSDRLSRIRCIHKLLVIR
jgi:hypothetical protein